MSMKEVGGQGHPDTPLLPVTLYTAPLTGIDKTVIRSIVVANVTPAPARYRITLDLNGPVHAPHKALFWDIKLRGNSTESIDFYLNLNPGGTLQVACDTAGAMTFSFGGAEMT